MKLTTKRRRPPVPLCDPRGVVYAFACPYCLRVGAHVGDRMGGDRVALRDLFRDESRDEARRCGACRDCGTTDPRHTPWTRYHRCGACERAYDAKLAAFQAEHAAQAARDTESFAAGSADPDEAWRFTLACGREGSIVTASDVFTSAFARLDATEDDPVPPVFSATLQRSETATPMEALVNLLLHYDDAVVAVRRTVP